MKKLADELVNNAVTDICNAVEEANVAGFEWYEIDDCNYLVHFHDGSAVKINESNTTPIISKVNDYYEAVGNDYKEEC
jgi:hypothetical protein